MSHLEARSRTAREHIGSDNASQVSRMGGGPFTTASSPFYKAVVQTEVRSTEGAALWVVRGFSKLDDKVGFCIFSPEFQMAGHC